MTTNLNRSEAVRKYFTKTPVEPSKPNYQSHQTKIGIGGGLLLLALILFSSGKAFPIFLGIVSGYFGSKFLTNGFSSYSREKKKYEKTLNEYREKFSMAEPKPSDEQIDEWMENDIEKIVKEAIIKLDLQDEDVKAKPFMIGGPASQLKETKYASGKDEKTRYSHFEILVVFLTDYHVAAYQSINSMEIGQPLTDKTQEFPYKEITNLGTETVKHEFYLINGKSIKENGLQAFILATSGANLINIGYRFARNIDSQGELIKIGGEHTISAIRKKLQDYKQKYEM